MQSVSTASTRAMIDTTILVYASDPTDQVKQKKATALLQELFLEKRMVLSTQALNEFYQASTRAHKPPSLSHEAAVQILRDLAAVAEVVPVTPAITFRALDAVVLYRMSLWDALIWAAAKENGVSLIYTEDLPSAPNIEGVQYIDPFQPEE